MKTFRTTIVMGVAVALGAAGCGGKEEAPAGADAAAVAPAPADDAAPDDKATAPPETGATEADVTEAKNDPLAAPADVAAPPADAKKTESGLAYKVLSGDSSGVKPAKRDTVKVHYTGWTTDGKKFDSSVERGTPATFPLNGVIPGWTEGLQLMGTGDKFRFWIPGNLAYGDTPRRPGAPAGMLVFDVELLEVQKAPTVDAPEDVAAAPADATRTESGLAYKVIKQGEGTEHPKATDRVTVHYSGWTTDGEMFDSSVVRNAPATFPLNGVIKGWTEGVQLMKVGDKFRFWIPGALAYGETPTRPGAPAGTLVFDVELIKIN